MKISLIAIAATLLSYQVAPADLLIDPAGGTSLQVGPNNDDVSAGRSLGFAGFFFGTAYATVDVATNGNLNFSGNTSSANTSLPTSVARISPLWDDFVISSGGSGESVSEKLDLGISYSVTWRAHHSTGSDALFQITWFGAATNVHGFDFLSGDIAFSYATVFGNFGSGNASIGLDAGNSSKFVSLPGDADGLITNSQVALLPTATGQFILFRPAGSSYSASVQSVPEPSPAILSIAGILLLLIFTQRTRPNQATTQQILRSQ